MAKQGRPKGIKKPNGKQSRTLAYEEMEQKIKLQNQRAELAKATKRAYLAELELELLPPTELQLNRIEAKHGKA